MDWTRGPPIGRGSSATVSLATTGGGGTFAVKSTDVYSAAPLQREESLLSQLCCPYIVKCFGSDISRENGKHVFNVFLEYVSGGTLFDLIKKRGGRLEESAIRFYLRRLLCGLDYLHRKGIVHGDVKPQNILVAGDGGLRIADFGCSRWLGRGDSDAQALAGTPAYMAPEVARSEEQGFAADIWALGCTVIEMATGSNPWPGVKDPAAVLYRVGYSGDVPDIPSWLSDDAGDFLSKCLIRDFKERWTAGELLQHPFLDSVEENCGCGELVGEITRRTPTSVVDGGFWSDLEASDSSRGPPENDISPAVRIRELIGDGNLPESNFAVWTEEEEDWLTVRGNGGSTVADSVTIISVDDDVVVTSDLTEDALIIDARDNIAFPLQITNVKCNSVFGIAIINSMIILSVYNYKFFIARILLFY
ncbi:mitogen-activated protein kinase kinase kinase 18-like [Andrographis paniculata]|uniref:mitogen-activated protein kinase kinase kinase 18-like n=1 Tax=Andrographis paniculata TaxID=175694 RepID=UPI0021E74728|nr:mitogen-activated protein kinase kinase kinase 18-like [Andrographis paniculata]